MERRLKKSFWIFKLENSRNPSKAYATDVKKAKRRKANAVYFADICVNTLNDSNFPYVDTFLSPPNTSVKMNKLNLTFGTFCLNKHVRS